MITLKRKIGRLNSGMWISRILTDHKIDHGITRWRPEEGRDERETNNNS